MHNRLLDRILNVWDGTFALFASICLVFLMMGSGCDTKESTPCKRVGNVYAHSGKVYNCIQGVQGPEWHKVKG